MPDAFIHPTPQQLSDFGLGKLPESAASVVAAHLESCPACRKAVADLPPDSFLNKVRAVRSDGSFCPPGLARPGPAPSIASSPSLCPDLPPELARHPRYLILRELGRGGMGVVYQARHKEMNRQVVIKVINRALLDRPDSLERFHREVRAAALLSHPNIVTAYDAEQVGESHMLVMEFVPGQSLAEVLHKNGPLPIAHACLFARQVALGLQHAHERNMVHRDIKPQNLMLSLKNQVKILDFGLAKVISERDKSKGLTPSDTCMGTPEYLAPEQAQNAAKADIRADLYSLGCTLYCLLAGRPPFREDTWMNTVLAHIQKQPQPLTELRPDVPMELWQLVARLLAKDPEQRYQKPIEVAQVLVPFIKSGAKPEAKIVSAPAGGISSPGKGTMFELVTRDERKIARDVTAKPKPKGAPPKDAASPFADLTDSEEEEGANSSLAAWWKRPGVMAVTVGASLAMLLMAVIIKAVPTSGDTGREVSPKVVRGTPKPLPDPAPTPEPKPKPPTSNPTERKPQPEQGDDRKTPKESGKDSDKPERTPEGSNKPKPEPPPAPKPEPPPRPELGSAQIDKAIAAGVKALRRLQAEDGTWPHAQIGATALAGLTLLECGTPSADTAVQRAADVVRKAVITLTYTYSISLSILFLDRLGDPGDKQLIKSLMVRLLAGQDAKSGGWSYGCPPASAAEMRRLQVIVDKRKTAADRREPPKGGMQAQQGVSAPQKAADPPMIGRPGDNSNTQFAALALWIGRRHGVPIDRALTRLVQRFRTMQREDGGWPYSHPLEKPAKDPLPPGMGSTASMTCAGLFCLAVGSAAHPKYLNIDGMNVWKELAVSKGLSALPTMIDQSQGVGGRTYYYLWALERMAIAFNLTKIGDKDWYEWGARILLDNQKEDGSWQGSHASCGADTCFALLFLKRSNLIPRLTTLIQHARRDGRWVMQFNAPNSANYIDQLRGLGAILAIPVHKHGDGFDYRIVRNLSARPARLLNEDIQKFQQEVQVRIRWVDSVPKNVAGVLSVLRLPHPNIKTENLHFCAFMPEELEQKLYRLEMDYLRKRHPGRSEDDILVTKFRIKDVNGNYEPEVMDQKLK